MFCSGCGAELRESDEYCSKCGCKTTPQAAVSIQPVIHTKVPGRFHRFCVALLIIWTVWWLGLSLGVLGKVSNAGSTAALMGVTLGIGMYAFFWFLPSLVLGVVAIATRPSPSVGWPRATKIATTVLSVLAFLWTFGATQTGRQGQTSNPKEVSASEAAGTAPAHTWSTDEGVSQMDGSKTITLSLEAEDEIQGWLDQQRPELIIRCKERSTNVYVITGMSSSVEYGTETHTVRLRFDDSSPQVEHWSSSTDDKALFAPIPVKLARRLSKSKVFRFEFTPFQASPTIAEFRVEGLGENLDKVAATCNWNASPQSQ